MDRNRLMKLLLAAFVLIATTFALLTRLQAAGSSFGDSTTSGSRWGAGPSKAQILFDAGVAAAKAEEYKKAYKFFKKANRKDRNNPDILNMLAYTQRKLGRLEDAFKNYGKALNQRPRFPEAREYLGEAHIQAALLEIETLDSYGEEGAEQLAKLKQAFRDAVAGL